MNRYVGNSPTNAVDPSGNVPPADYPIPPGWNENWRWEPPSGESPGNWRWWDPGGGEWRWHGPDKYHPNGQPHWDHNPWDSWNSKWRNVPEANPPTPKAPVAEAAAESGTAWRVISAIGTGISRFFGVLVSPIPEHIWRGDQA